MEKNAFIDSEGYGPAPESCPVDLLENYGHYIDGSFTDPASSSGFVSRNPSNGKALAEVRNGGMADVHTAVTSASKAFNKTWSRMKGSERGKYLFRIARLIQEKSRELAALESMDGGKPIRESRDVDLPLVAAHFFYYAGWADKLKFAFPGREAKPHGVAAQIIPWNFPLLMAAWKIAPALAAGNTVVLKPAESTPLTALKLAEIFQEADLPAGVVNIVTGDGETGKHLLEHPDINKAAFTGSTEVGKEIQRTIAGRNIPYTLELGGKAAHIVFEDAAIDQAVEGVVNGIFFNQGHVCCAGSRLYLQESIEELFIEKLEKRMATLIVGDPLDKNTDIGAINNPMQLAKITEMVDEAKAQGLEVYQSEAELPPVGMWYRPTLVKRAPQSCRISMEEVFGPVLTIHSFRTEAEAIQKANNTSYGLSGGVWSDKGSKVFGISSKIRSGVVWANCFNKFDPTSPFGGYKESGSGREGGLHGLFPYVKLG